jgi:hypothetical protein
MVNYNLWYKNIMQKEYFMKKTIVYGLLAVVLVLVFTACSGSGGGSGQRLTGPTDAFKFTVIDGGKAYSVSAGTAEGTVNIPSHYRPNADSDYLPVTEFKNGGGNITKVNIPSTVTTIGENAFYVCDNLTSVTLHEGLTTIGQYAFYGCTGLTSITLPKGLTIIGEGAFINCTNITSITVPASVTKVHYAAFFNWTPAQTINIQGKASREETIVAGWAEDWKTNCNAQINYGN